jgi:serine/threonine-protein kinase
VTDAVVRLNAALEGRYRIEREIGEGGMATVYLADDLRHERRVALKVLKPELAAVVGGERFLAEIKTTANLQHPHILPLFDSGESDGVLYYVMPFIEGETLGDRIAREKQLPVDEAVGIAMAVAGALDTAHEAGVVHRDIKPGNILLSRGQPLVADFGIALAVGTAGGSRLTETGLSVGTPFYMSPEQATGDQTIGPASDIYALAAVLYEMLVGEPPYVGNTAQAVLGKIIQGEPVSATTIRKSIPANVDAALQKALEKLPADRFTRAAEFARALSEPSFRYGHRETGGAAMRGGLWNPLSIGSTAVAALAVVGLGVAMSSSDSAPPAAAQRFETPLRPTQSMVGFDASSFNISADGSMLVYRGPPAEGTIFQLWVRSWGDIEASALRGTAGPFDPSFSPTGAEVVFTQGPEVKVAALEGGPLRTLGEGIYPRWGSDGFVYAFKDASIARIPGAGGEWEVLASAEDFSFAGVADVLPGEEGAVVWVTLEDNTDEVYTLDFESGELARLTAGGSPRYVATGHLLFTLDGSLMAAPFDSRSKETTGPSVSMIENVNAFAVSDEGTLYYTVGAGGGALQELVWVDRNGNAQPVDQGWSLDTGGSNAGWSMSADGTRVVTRERTEAGQDIWLKELGGGPRSRLTFHETEDRKPVWGPDDETVTFISQRGGNGDVMTRRADGTGAPELILDLEANIAEASWSPDGEWLVVRVAGTPGQTGGRDILGFRLGEGTEPIALLTEPHDEIAPQLSPDGRWLAYTSNETGQHEVFVRPFPDVDAGRWQVSTAGGFTPRWSRDGNEIFYVSGQRAMMAAEVETEPSFRVGTRSTLFTLGATFVSSDIYVPYDVWSGDQPFLMARAYRDEVDLDAPPDAILVLNWFDELTARVPN